MNVKGGKPITQWTSKAKDRLLREQRKIENEKDIKGTVSIITEKDIKDTVSIMTEKDVEDVALIVLEKINKKRKQLGLIPKICIDEEVIEQTIIYLIGDVSKQTYQKQNPSIPLEKGVKG